MSAPTPAAARDLPQGDVALLGTTTAQDLLVSTELARVAYVAKDGTPRVFPMLFHWTGDELVMCTFAGPKKIAAMRRHPDIAVTIDAPTAPPRVLLLRGRAIVDEVEGIVAEYRLAHLRYAGLEQGAANVRAVGHPGVRMARIGLRPTWVGVLDFVSRWPGGGSADEFDRRGS